jgi:4-hydroxy-3-methylbut-2-enyl diphosphate reductase
MGGRTVGSGTSSRDKRHLGVVLANPRGFCAGVERAIEIVERALALYGAPVYVRHEIVHNKRVVETLRAKGARFVEEVDEIPEGAVTVFSAHGVSPTVERGAGARGLHVIDATCPLVSKVHKEGRRSAQKGFEVVLIGHEGHPEVEGTMGQIDGTVHLVTCVADVDRLQPADPARLSYVTQTTLSVDDTRAIIDALRRRFPGIVGPDVKDICYATQNRQTAVRTLCREVDVLLVVGAHNSSNSNRLREIGEAEGLPSYLIEDANALNVAWLSGARSVGITAGASAPEELVEELVGRLARHFDVAVKPLAGVEENIQFKLPPELDGERRLAAAS